MGRWPAKRLTKLESNLQLVTVIPYDVEVCKTFGEIKATLEKSGVSVATNDLSIRLAPKRHSLVLVTNNRKDFKNIPGLTIISEAPLTRIPAITTPPVLTGYDTQHDHFLQSRSSAFAWLFLSADAVPECAAASRGRRHCCSSGSSKCRSLARSRSAGTPPLTNAKAIRITTFWSGPDLIFP